VSVGFTSLLFFSFSLCFFFPLPVMEEREDFSHLLLCPLPGVWFLCSTPVQSNGFPSLVNEGPLHSLHFYSSWFSPPRDCRTPAGMETPDVIDLRKTQRKDAEPQPDRPLYTVRTIYNPLPLYTIQASHAVRGRASRYAVEPYRLAYPCRPCHIDARYGKVPWEARGPCFVQRTASTLLLSTYRRLKPNCRTCHCASQSWLCLAGWLSCWPWRCLTFLVALASWLGMQVLEEKEERAAAGVLLGTSHT